MDGGVGWVFEEPFVGCEMARDCTLRSMLDVVAGKAMVGPT